jgi:hypothetical protein
VVGTVRLNFAQRVKLYDGPAELSPGITLHPVGGHTPGMRPAIHCAPMRRARITSSPATTRWSWGNTRRRGRNKAWWSAST